MKRILLFSQPTNTNRHVIFDLLLPHNMNNKTLSYMPSNGVENAGKYVDEWKNIASNYGAAFSIIDNQSSDSQDAQKILNSNILLLSGGNTFGFLNNLRKSGLDEVVKQFALKPDFVLAGFSAGALVLTPTIEICNLPNYDDNIVGINDLDGLGIVNFEVFPHYDKEKHQDIMQNYKSRTTNEVRPITDDGYIVIDIE